MIWNTAKLGDACFVRRGTTITKKNAVEGDVPVIGGGTKPTYFHNEPNREAGCITISGSGASAGFVNRWDMPIFASDCSTVEPKDEMQLPKFVYYYLLSQQQFIYNNFRSGAAQPHVYAKDIETLDFPILPLAEQQRIVAKLDAAFAEIDRAVELAQEAKTIASKIADASVKSALANHYFEWQTIDLGTIAENLDAKRVPITKSKRVEGDVPYYGASGIVDYVDGHLFNEELLLISEDGANLLMRTYPIAFSISGKTWVNNHAHVLRFSDRNTQKWVERYLNATDLTKFISGMAQPKLNQKKLNSIPIPLPNEKYMNDLLSVIDMTKQKGDELDKLQSEKALQLVQLKSAILAQELQPPQSEAA